MGTEQKAMQGIEVVNLQQGIKFQETIYGNFMEELIFAMEKYKLQEEQMQIKIFAEAMHKAEAELETIKAEMAEMEKQLKTRPLDPKQSELEDVVRKVMAEAMEELKNTEGVIWKLKRGFKEAGAGILSRAEEKKKEALQKMVSAARIPQILKQMQKAFAKLGAIMGRCGDRIGIARGELHAASIHKKNVRKAIKGEELSNVMIPENQKGILARLQRMLWRAEKEIQGITGELGKASDKMKAFLPTEDSKEIDSRESRQKKLR